MFFSHYRQFPILLFLSDICIHVQAFTAIAPQSARIVCSTEHASKKAVDDDLLKALDDSFDYEGRLKGASFENYRCGFVSILGAPNMGKSTLLNALLREDLCIATARPQTTRHAILGLLTNDNVQVCFIDTPGIIENPAYKLQEGMMEAVVGALNDADVLLVVTDIFSTPIPSDKLFQKVANTRKSVIVAVNKADLASKVNAESVDKNIDKTISVEQAVVQWRQLLPNALGIIPCTAKNGPDDPGVTALRKLLMGGPDLPAAIRDLGRPVPGMFLPSVKLITDEEASELLPISPPLYDQEMLTDRTERFIASEMIRSTLFESLKKELPYCCEVQITEFKEPKENDANPIIRMKASILVERDSQKIIIIGSGGEQIKKIGIRSREKLEAFFQAKVVLQLNVKVNKDWRKKEETLKQFGYLK